MTTLVNQTGAYVILRTSMTLGAVKTATTLLLSGYRVVRQGDYFVPLRAKYIW